MADPGAGAPGQVPAAAPAAAAKPVAAAAQAPIELLQKNTCTACHAPDRKLVGPSWGEVAKKHGGKADYLAAKIRSGGSGTWGSVPMPPQSISEADAGRIAPKGFPKTNKFGALPATNGKANGKAND